MNLLNSGSYDTHLWQICVEYCYRPQTKFAKVMFLHLSVILFTGGVSASVHAGIHPPEQTPTPHWEQTPPSKHTPPWEQTPPCMLGDTGNKRAVRILVECVLVQLVLE